MAQSENEDLPEKADPAPPDQDEQESQLGLTDQVIDDIEEALDSGHEDAVVDALADMGAADTAELLARVDEESRTRLVQDLTPALDPGAFSEMDDDLRRETLAKLEPAQIAAIITELESDDAIAIIEDLEPQRQQEIIRRLSANLRVSVQEGLSFPEDSAGRLMQRSFVAIPQFWTVGKTIDYLRAAAADLPEDFFDIFVISPTYQIVGEIPLHRLISARRPVKMAGLVQDEIHPIPAAMDQEEVAGIFRRDNLTSAPVVDEENRLLGVITVDDIVDVIHEEAQEDILKLGGVGSGDLYRAILSTTGSRFRWLFVNLLTAILASIVISFFDATIEEIVALAVLMPIVASMGGNAGTQTLTVAVRAIATRQLSRGNTLRIIGKETVVGALNGAGFAVIAGIVTALWFGNPTLGAVIGAAMIINLICAGFFGACIPVILHRLGADPAVSSSVFLTTVTDVVGFLAFLGLASLFLI